MPLVAIIVQLIVNIATAVLVPTLFIGKQTAIPILGYTLQILPYAYLGILAYVLANAWSAQRRPGGEAYYHLDLWPSILSWLGIFGTAFMVFALDVNKDFVATLPGSTQMLVACVVAAGYDLLINQRRNTAEMIARITNQPSRGLVPSGGAFDHYDTPLAAVAAGLVPTRQYLDLIIRPFMEQADGSLRRWSPQPLIEHEPQAEPPGGGREERPQSH